MLKRVFMPERFTGWHMLGVLGLFFGTIVAVNAVLAVFASGTWTGLVVKNSYVASQHYNEKLEAADRQAARGWTGRLSYEQGRLAFRLDGPDGAPILAERVSAEIGRPAHESRDHTLELARTGPGRYAAPDDLEAGLWQVTVRAERAGEPDWHLTYRLSVPAADGQEAAR
jgi:nitrogen fixation protein FixH